MKRTKSGYLFILVMVLIIGLVFPSMAYGKNVAGALKNDQQKGPKDVNKLVGAIWATDANGKVINKFEEKDDVYVKIGKQKEHEALTGVYYIKVTDPSGKEPLGSGTVKMAEDDEVINDKGLVSLWDVTEFDDTPNHGGVYKVWVSTSQTYENKYSKTDTFKIGEGNTGTRPEAPSDDFTGVRVVKFYDANVNGIKDNGEDELNWIYNITPSENNRYETMDGDVELDSGSYDISEYTLEDWNWQATTDTVQKVNIVENELETVHFGNVFLTASSAKEIEYWIENITQANKHRDPITSLTALNLVDEDGDDFAPNNRNKVARWLEEAIENEDNIPYSLSAQLAVMKMNTMNGFVNYLSYIYIDSEDIDDFDVEGLNAYGFIKVEDLMNAANDSLGGTLGGTGLHSRDYQEFLIEALQQANNNEDIYVQSEPPAEPYFPVLTETDNVLDETFGAVRFRNFDNNNGGEVFLSNKQERLGTVNRAEIDFYRGETINGQNPYGDWKDSNHFRFEYDADTHKVKVRLDALYSYAREYVTDEDIDLEAIQFIVLNRQDGATVKLENIVVNGLPVQDSITGDSSWTKWNLEKFIEKPDGGFVVEADLVLIGTQPKGEWNKVEIVFGKK